MRIAVPLCSKDVEMIPDWCAAMAHYGGLEDHHIFICPTPTQIQAAEDMAEMLVNACTPNVIVRPLENEFHGPWPSGANNHFVAMARLIAREPLEMPWLNCELDGCPIAPNWIDRLANGLQMAGRNVRYIGKWIPTLFKTADGRTETPPGDEFMMGTAIYDHSMANESVLKHELQDCEFGNRTGGMGYDMYLRHCFKRLGAAKTDLIADQWSTGKYRIENDKLVCEAIDDGRSPRKRGGIVDPHAVFVHGCKDLTLHQMVAEGKMPQFIAPRQAPAARKIIQMGSYQKREEAQDPVMTMLMEQRKDMMAMQRQMLAMMAKISGQEISVPESASAGAFAEAAQATAEEAPAKDLPFQKVLDFMGGKTKTVPQIAKGTGLDEEVVRETVDACESLELSKGPIPWVKVIKKAAA